MLYLHSQDISTNQSEVVFYIEKPIGLEELGEKLKSIDVIESVGGFVALGEHKGIDETNIATGKYVLKPSTPVRYLLNGFKINRLGNGNAEVEVDVVVPSVRFVEDLAERVSDQLAFSKTDFLKGVESSKALEELNISIEDCHQILLTNTYKMYYDTSVEDFLTRMTAEAQKFWSDDKLIKLKALGLKSKKEAVTLASIVYAEQSKLAEEWPTIAGLYLNRIRRGQRLESDPTFKYCWGKELDTVQRLLAKHREIDCNYNTYRIKGLPPGPINFPPIACVEAVLNAESNQYIFMVAAPNYSGEHLFSRSFNEHLRNARIYQNWLRTQSN